MIAKKSTQMSTAKTCTTSEKIPTRGNTSLTAKLRKQSLYIHYKEGKKGTCSTKSVLHGLRCTDNDSSIDITTDLPLIQRSCNVLNLISDVIVQ